MDEPVRWVTKAEAARELEVSLSTLDRMIRKGGVEVAREGRRVHVRMHGPVYLSDDELLRQAIIRADDLARTVRELERGASGVRAGTGRCPGRRIRQQRRVRGVDGGVSQRARRAREDKASGSPACPGRGRLVRAASRQRSGHVATVHVGVCQPYLWSGANLSCKGLGSSGIFAVDYVADGVGHPVPRASSLFWQSKAS